MTDGIFPYSIRTGFSAGSEIGTKGGIALEFPAVEKDGACFREIQLAEAFCNICEESDIVRPDVVEYVEGSFPAREYGEALRCDASDFSSNHPAFSFQHLPAGCLDAEGGIVLHHAASCRFCRQAKPLHVGTNLVDEHDSGVRRLDKRQKLWKLSFQEARNSIFLFGNAPFQVIFRDEGCDRVEGKEVDGICPHKFAHHGEGILSA